MIPAVQSLRRVVPAFKIEAAKKGLSLSPKRVCPYRQDIEETGHSCPLLIMRRRLWTAAVIRSSEVDGVERRKLVVTLYSGDRPFAQKLGMIPAVQGLRRTSARRLHQHQQIIGIHLDAFFDEDFFDDSIGLSGDGGEHFHRF